MTCDEVRDLLPEYVSGGLGEREQHAVEAHLGHGCGACRSELDATAHAVALLAECLTPTAPRASLKREVFRRVDERYATPATVASPLEPGAISRGVAPFALYAAVTLCGIGLGVLAAGVWPYGDAGARVIARSQLDAGMQAWQRRVAAAEQAFGQPRAQLVGLSTKAGDPSLQAVVFFDRTASQFHVLAAGPQLEAAGGELWAWLRDEEGAVLAAGPLKKINAMQAAGVVDLPGQVESLHDVLFTDETAGPHDEPSDLVVGSAAVTKRP